MHVLNIILLTIGLYKLRLWYLTAKLFSSDDLVLAETTFSVQFRARLSKPKTASDDNVEPAPKRVRLEEPAAVKTNNVQPAIIPFMPFTINTHDGVITVHPVLTDAEVVVEVEQAPVAEQTVTELVNNAVRFMQRQT